MSNNMKPKKMLNNVRKSDSSKLETPQPEFTKVFSLCVITQFFPPDYAPTGQLIDELTQSLSTWEDIKIHVFSGQPDYAFRSSTAPSSEQRNQVYVMRSKVVKIWPERIRGKAINGLLFFIAASLHLLKKYRQYNVVLLTTAPPFLPVLGYLLHYLLKIPYVCVIYDLYPDIAVELGVISPKHWLARVWRAMNYQIWQHAKGIVVLSSSMKQRIVSYCPEVEGNISVIHSWANPESIAPIPKEQNWFAQKYGLVKDFTILYSGNMGRCHDMETILQAIEQLQYEQIQFVFIGGGSKRAKFIEETHRLKLSNCLFLPYQDKAMLPYSLTACNLSLVSISAGMENLVAPSKLYSALSAGRPIAAICPKNSYLNQLITDANCGLSFENGDSQGLVQFIRFLSQEAKVTEQLGINGRQYLIQNFAPEQITAQYHNVLRRVAFSEKIDVSLSQRRVSKAETRYL